MFGGSFVAVATGFESNAIDAAIYFRRAGDLCDALAKRNFIAEIDNFAAKTLGLLQAFGNHVADDYDSRAQQLA